MKHDFPVRRMAMLSVHTSPLAALGQQKTGGMNVYVRDFSRELARRGIAVDIFTRASSPNEPAVLFDMGCGCRVFPIPAGPPQAIPNDDIVHYLDEFTEGVQQVAEREQLGYDLLHSHYWLSGVVAGKLRQVWGPVPMAHMYHTLGHMKNQIARSASELSSPVRLVGETYVASIADRLIAATPAEEAQLLELYNANPRKISVITPGVDVSRFQPVSRQAARRHLNLPADERLVLLVGRIEPLKGIDTLLRATALLRDQSPEAVRGTRVAIIGGDPAAQPLSEEMARLQQLTAALGVQDMVEFWGAKDQALLPNYYAAADLVVMPSHYESFGMVSLEAMAMGTPVIASRVGGLAHLVQDGVTGFLVPPQCPGALAERMHQLLLDPALRARLSAQARAHASTYDWATIVDQMLDVYEVLTDAYVLY